MSPWLIAAWMSLAPVGDGTHLDAPIIPGSRALEDVGRYESPRTWDDTLLYYKWHFKSRGGVRTRNIVNLPHIRAKYIQSTRHATKWQGLNIYEKNGRVRVFVVPRAAEATPPKAR